ncbi:MAG: tetratricopeptide repeat protein, partial [Planctomycetaceae bacterium]|nr:tetratricopeptide repeat protein [Planctomycetaceae bacterium]
VAEMFTTMQKLQENFQKSLGQVEELQQVIKDVMQKQPEQEKKYQEIQKRYEELLRNQKLLSEQAIPAKLFARARDAYKAEKFDEAMKDFKKFTQNFGSHPLADNAYLYIGDIHRKRKELSPALLAYSTIIKKYPNESEVPRALFRLGLLSYQNGQCSAGRRYFLQLSRYRRQAPKLAKDARQFYRRSSRFCKKRRRR